jgi:hypothetical protein
LQEKRRKALLPFEQRMEDFKRRHGKTHDPENDLVFADMLSEYG